MDGQPQSVQGEDLFLLIDGGAESYLRLGFRRAITATYKNTSGKIVNLEIFEMKTSIGAQEVYKQKTSERGKRVPLGNDALLEDYYLNYWKDRFQITLTGYDTAQETIEALMSIGRKVDKRIPPP